MWPTILRLGTALALALIATLGVSQERIGPLGMLLARPDDLTFTVTAKDDGSGLHVQGTVATDRGAPVEVAYGAAALEVRVYRSPDRTGVPVWDLGSRSVRLYRVHAVVSREHPVSAPEFSIRISGADLPGVPDGTYYVTARIRLSVPTISSGEMPAGTLVVRRR